jgi:hypothetical protein
MDTLDKAPDQEAPTYEADFVRWLEHQAALLRQGRVHELDLENLAEEVDDIGRSQRRAVESELSIILIHLLKYQFQPLKRSRSWVDTLLEHRGRLARDVSASKSLRLHAEAELSDLYRLARKRAAVQTQLPLDNFPETIPYTLAQVLDEDFFPEG